ncbi:MAG: DUF86 domain-containing protein [Erysipelotrichaceae bacterium]|jgi:hypothetical protein|nr:DUF86 domain-containing protein [Erysipelotrichaceae bacterium]
MLSVRDKGLLLGIIKHCRKILEKTESLPREAFDQDEDVVEIVCFNIMQIGELAKGLSPEFITRFNDVPWKQIKGMRDKVAHGYGTIDLDRVWSTAQENVAPLLKYCQSILDDDR